MMYIFLDNLFKQMKKILSIIFIFVLWFVNQVKAEEYQQLNISIGCWSTGQYLRHLDRTKKDYHVGFIMDTNIHNGKKTPEFNVMINFTELKDDIKKNFWKGEIIYNDHEGKKVFNPTNLNNLSSRYFTIDSIRKLSENNIESLKIRSHQTSDTEEDYYIVKYLKVYSYKKTSPKKEIEMGYGQNMGNFQFTSEEYICFE